jgi:hypothetical protein
MWSSAAINALFMLPAVFAVGASRRKKCLRTFTLGSLKGSVRAYARHRKETGLPGVDPMAVEKALRTGRIPARRGRPDRLRKGGSGLGAEHARDLAPDFGFDFGGCGAEVHVFHEDGVWERLHAD